MQQSRFWYFFGHMVTRLIAPLFWEIKVEYEGELEAMIQRQEPPFDKRIVLCPKHRHWADPYLIGTFAWDRPTRLKRRLWFLANAKLFIWPFSVILRGQGAIPVKRGAVDRAAIRQAIRVLEAEQPLVIFVEGTRQPNCLGPLQAGVRLLAARTAAPILPIGTEITNREFTIRVGQPIEYSDQLLEELGQTLSRLSGNPSAAH